MSRIFFAGVVSGVVLATAVALADNQGTKDLIRSLSAGDEAARLRAIDTLGEEGETTPEAVAALTAQLKDRSATIRRTPPTLWATLARPLAPPSKPWRH